MGVQIALPRTIHSLVGRRPRRCGSLRLIGLCPGCRHRDAWLDSVLRQGLPLWRRRALRAGADRIVLAAAREIGPLGIRVNAVNPGPVDTGWMDDAIREGVARRQPTGRLGTPADVAKLVAFLLSDEGAWVSGQVIHADGGYSAPS